jgi:hypothetical protein
VAGECGLPPFASNGEPQCIFDFISLFNRIRFHAAPYSPASPPISLVTSNEATRTKMTKTITAMNGSEDNVSCSEDGDDYGHNEHDESDSENEDHVVNT